MGSTDYTAWSLVAVLAGWAITPIVPVFVRPASAPEPQEDFTSHEEACDCSGDLRKIIGLQSTLEWWRLLCLVLGGICAFLLFIFLCLFTIRLCCCTGARRQYPSKVLSPAGLPYGARPLAALPLLSLSDGAAFRDGGAR
jgi:hypothetical protein